MYFTTILNFHCQSSCIIICIRAVNVPGLLESKSSGKVSKVRLQRIGRTYKRTKLRYKKVTFCVCRYLFTLTSYEVSMISLSSNPDIEWFIQWSKLTSSSPLSLRSLAVILKDSFWKKVDKLHVPRYHKENSRANLLYELPAYILVLVSSKRDELRAQWSWSADFWIKHIIMLQCLHTKDPT